VTGHKTLKEVSRYTSAANRADLADAGLGKLRVGLKVEQNVANHPKRFAKKRPKRLSEKEN
jgi:hypothetical protein